MKILIVGPIPQQFGGKAFGGIATHIYGLSKELSKKGHEVSLWYHKPLSLSIVNKIKVINNSWVSYLLSLLNFEVLISKNYNYLTFKQRLLLAYQIHRLKKVLSNTKYDLIHIHSLHNTSSIALEKANKSKVPYIITDHGFWQNKQTLIKESKAYLKIKNCVKYSKSIIYISEYAKSMHEEVDFDQLDQLVKIKNPINFIFREKVIKDNQKNVIFFNGLTESIKIKNLDVLLKAIESDPYLKNNSEVIVIANQEGINYINQNKFGYKIELHSALKWSDVIELYNRSDLLVVPSKSESFGLVYLEALSFGIPVIGFEGVINEFQLGIQEYIGEGFDANNETHRNLAEKIKKALKTPFKEKNVSHKLKEIYSWEDNIVNYEGLYKKIQE